MKKIKCITVFYGNEETNFIKATEELPIEMFTKNGEMAPVEWFRKGNLEVNGRFVIDVEYEQ